MGFLDFISGGLANQPQYTPTPLDPNTLALIQQEAARGGLSPDQITSQELQGTSPTMENATGGAIAQQQSTLGGSGGPQVGEALNNRAARLYNSQYNELQNQAKAQAPLMQAGYMNNATNALQGQQNVANANNTNAMQAIANQNAMRSKVIGQLFGGAGSFAGTMAASGGSNYAPQTPPIQNSNGQGVSNNGYEGYGSPGSESFSSYHSNSIGMPSSYGGYGSPGQAGNGYYGELYPGLGGQ